MNTPSRHVPSRRMVDRSSTRPRSTACRERHRAVRGNLPPPWRLQSVRPGVPSVRLAAVLSFPTDATSASRPQHRHSVVFSRIGAVTGQPGGAGAGEKTCQNARNRAPSCQVECCINQRHAIAALDHTPSAARSKGLHPRGALSPDLAAERRVGQRFDILGPGWYSMRSSNMARPVRSAGISAI